jgi:hypothetical protein
MQDLRQECRPAERKIEPEIPKYDASTKYCKDAMKGWKKNRRKYI